MANGAAPGSVALVGVTRHYGDSRGVEALSLTAGGEFLTLVGPSGSGKSTTLRLIGGFLRPAAGTITLGGRDMTGVPPDQRPVHTVFQSFALFPHLTVDQNVAYPLRMAGIERREQSRRVMDALDLVRLTGVGHRRPDQLSGGQQQRVALARALVNRPPILLLDEPLGALDAQLRQEMQGELKRLQREVGATFISVTHDQSEALATADRMAVLREGRLVEVGPPRQLYERPRTRFVARFVSRSNLLAGTLLEAGDGCGVVRLPGGGTVRGRLEATPPAPGTPVTVVARPESVLVSPGEGPPGDAALPATIIEIDFGGAVWRTRVRLADGSEVVAHEPVAWEDSARLRRGDAAWVRLRPEETLVLIDDGGNRAEFPDH